MAHGFEAYDDTGRLQISTEDPLLYAPLKQEFADIGIISFDPGDGFQHFVRREDVSLAVLPQSEIIAIRPRTSGVFGFLQWANGNYMYAVGNGNLQFTGGASSVGTLAGGTKLDYVRIKETGELTPGTGYGLQVFDAGGDLTFSTSTGETIQGYFDILSITSAGTTNNATSFPGKLIYTGNAATWDGVYVIANNLGFRHEYWHTNQFEPTDQKNLIFSRTVWFDHNNYKIYAVEFDLDATTAFDSPAGTCSVAPTWTSTLQNTYYVVRYV